MDNASARAEEQGAAPETPEDVAILYSWANLPGAKYRDFSASRREFRAQQRARIAEAQRQAELKAARDLEEAAEREVQTAQREVEQARTVEVKADADAAQAAMDAAAKRDAEDRLRRAEQRAEQERQEAVRRQEAAEELRIRAERAQEEMLAARKRAEAQAARYAEADAHPSAEAASQSNAVPGETTDPYYYSGPVDPAYFAPTPGVRTARATRTSTERKPYAHPGSEDYDSGTAATYRASNQFGPSPALQGAQPRSEDEPLPNGNPAETERSRPRIYEAPGPNHDFDGSYYQQGRATRLFAPTHPGLPGDGADTLSADHHIRPVRDAVARTSDRRPVRPSPEELAPSPERRLQSEAPLPSVGSTLRTSTAEEHVLPEARGTGRDGLFTAIPDRSSMLPVPYREMDNVDEEDHGSRMFLPGPRRRLSQGHSRSALDSASRLASGWWREGSALDGELGAGEHFSFTEVEGRRDQDAYLEPENARHFDKEMLPAEPIAERSLRTAEEPLSAQGGEAPRWRPTSRMERGESASRRRRQPAREPVARTARQPRSLHDADLPEEGGRKSGEASGPPAWLSEERALRFGDVERKAGDALLEDLPASPGDPDVPAPRHLVRRPSGEMRLRAPLPSSAASANSAANHGEAAPLQDSPQRAPGSTTERAPSAADTLQQSRERVASRWFALSGLMGAESRPSPEPRQSPRTMPHPSPMLCVLSISGGVGKTSIVATLGRALSSLGEKVMLADTNVHGILPYYFGAREHRPGAVRTFTPPPGSSDAPVVLVSYDADGRSSDEEGQKHLVEDLYRRSDDVQRVLVDAGVNSVWLARTLASTNPWVLVPVAPDMNSVLGTQAVERLFQDVVGADGQPIKPYYVLNQYDATMPLHLDVREVLRQFLGDRLLPIMLHRTPAVSEALAEGMTVMDYAPRTPIATDYMNLAKWVRQLAEPGFSSARPARWSER